MPDLPLTGAQIILKGEATYIRAIGRTSRAIVDLGVTTKRQLDALKDLDAALVKVVNSSTKVALAEIRANKSTRQSIMDKQKVHEASVKEAAKSMSDQLAFQMKFSKDMARESGKMADAQTKEAQRAADAQAKAAKKAADDQAREAKRAADEMERNAKRTANAAINMAAGVGGAIGGGGGIGNILGGVAGAVGGAMGGPWGMVLNLLPQILKIAAWANPITGSIMAIGSALSTVGRIAGAILAPIGRVFSALASIGGSIVSAGISVASNALQVLGAIINALLTPIRWLGEQIRQVFVVTVGVLMRDAIRGAINALQELLNMIFEGGASMQLMQIRLQGMLATEIQSTRTTIDFAQAMRYAVIPTRELIDWINILAVKSPFERSTIADTVALGMALDFTSDQAKTITKALVDWASGMGLEGDAITRILYNFGQMRAQGKLTGQELRDAARGGLIPVLDILRDMGEELGYTGEKLNNFIHNAAEEGADVDTFFAKFIELAETRFPNAAERMSRTWSGVTNNIKDFIKTVLGADVLTPVLDRIAGKMADALNSMLSPEVRQQFMAIGESLVYAFDVVYPKIQSVIRAVLRLGEALGLPKLDAYDLGAAIEIVADNIAGWLDVAASKVEEFAVDVETYFAQLGTNALAYGANTAIQWANGFIEGVSTAVVGALNALTALLTEWLKGMSPPKIVPHIGEWGAHTFEEWLKGFSDADFGVLDTVGDAVNSALNALVGLGKLDKDKVGGIYGGILKGLAKGVEGGGFSESFLKKIKNQLGEFGGAIVKLLKDQMAYAKATDAAAAAEKALADAQKASSAQRVKVNGMIKDYNAALRAGASREVLGQKLAAINVEEKVLKVQQDQVIAAEKAAQDAKDKADALKETAALQEKLVSELVKLGGAYAIDLTVDTSGLTGGLSSANQALTETGNYFNKTGVELDKFKLKNGEAAESITSKLSEKKKELEGLLNALSLQWTIFYDANFNTASPTSRVGAIIRAFNELATKAGELKTNLLEQWNLIGADFLFLYQTYLDPYTATTPVFNIIEGFKKWYEALKPVAQWFADNKDAIGIAMAMIWAGISAVIWLIIEPIKIWLGILQGIVNAIKWINEHPIKITNNNNSGDFGQCGAGMYWDGSKCVKDTGEAAGGPVASGRPYVVGERGWEYFVPNVAGYIIPHNLSSAITRVLQQRRENMPMPRSSMMASGPVAYTRVVNVVFEHVSISNGMDLAQLEAVIHRTVMRDL